MINSLPVCTKCSALIPAEFVNTGEFQPCPSCSTPLRLEIFPAHFREIIQGSPGESLAIDTEASCFNHSQKRASVICGSCGRYLCSLCDFEVENSHYCSACLQGAKSKNKIASIENHRTLYDVIVFQLSVLGILIFYFSPITAPVVIYFTIKHWKTPLSIVRTPSRWRFVVGFTLATLQVLGWLTLIGYFLTR